MRATEKTRINTLLNRNPEFVFEISHNTLQPKKINHDITKLYQWAETNEEITLSDLAIQKSMLQQKLADYTKRPDFNLGARYTGFGGTSLNPNVVGIVSIGLGIVSLSLLQFYRSPSWPSCLLLLSAVVLMGHGMMTLSRTAIVGLIISVFLYMIRKWNVYTIVGVLVVSIGVAVAVIYEGVESRLFDVDALKNASNRLPIWVNTLRESMSNLVAGVGVGADVKFYGANDVLYEHPHDAFTLGF